MEKSFKLPTLKCIRCNHEWIPRKAGQPKFCPKCRSPYWNTEPTKRGRWKFAIGDRFIANDKAPIDYKGKFGTIVERGPGKAEYGVIIDNEEEKSYLNSPWIDRVNN